MNVANISFARNHLSELLHRVREGESILIMDRNVPVAQLDPPPQSGQSQPSWKNDLIRRGIICPAKSRLDPQALLAMPLPAPVKKGDILSSLLADREESR